MQLILMMLVGTDVCVLMVGGNPPA